MSVRFDFAKTIGAAASWTLKNVFHSAAGNFPGKMALYADPDFIRNIRGRCEKGSVLVVGTNGKTTVTNLLSDCLETAGQTVVCNRGGANLASGIATALLSCERADWGVFEIDELWLYKVAQGLQPTYVVLLDLFRDQLDRMGEIDTIQTSIAKGLQESPGTILIYNADDPNCAAIASSVKNKSVAFGIDESLRLPQDEFAPAQMCAQCGGVLEYVYRQYDQLGRYRCPSCSFGKPELDYAACNVTINAGGIGFDIEGRHVRDAAVEGLRLHARWNGAYMVYNLTAVGTAALLMGCSLAQVQDAIDAFDPKNGRLQWITARGRKCLLNLAKNPTGFNQNIQIILQDEQPCAAAFFVNDAEGDGRDPSWIWNVDFEAFAARPEIRVFAGGARVADLLVRLKYAGVDASPVEGAQDILEAMVASGMPTEARAYVIANYTALPPLREEFETMVASQEEQSAAQAQSSHGAYPDSREDELAADDREKAAATDMAAIETEVRDTDAPEIEATGADEEHTTSADGKPVVILHIYPDLLGVFGDGGNARVLAQRLRWRGIPVEVRAPRHGEVPDFGDVDIVVLGASMGREQQMAAQNLAQHSRLIQQFVETDGVILGICGGYRMLGQTWTIDGKSASCLAGIEVETKELSVGKRILGDVAVKSSLVETPIIGFYNHTGATKLKPSLEPFGVVAAAQGESVEADEQPDGVLFKNVVGTNLHGPVLAKNPEFADELLRRALAHWAHRTGGEAPQLIKLDDEAEHRAYSEMAWRFGVQ